MVELGYCRKLEASALMKKSCDSTMFLLNRPACLSIICTTPAKHAHFMRNAGSRQFIGSVPYVEISERSRLKLPVREAHGFHNDSNKEESLVQTRH